MPKTKPKTPSKPPTTVATKAVTKAPATSIRPAVKRRRAGEASFTVSVHDNRVELVIHDAPVVSCDVNGPEFYNALFRDVKARIEKGE
jgi:hypothetical protein